MALQFAVPHDAAKRINIVYVDSLRVTPFASSPLSPIEMTCDNTFDTISENLEGLNPGPFMPSGETPGTVSLADGVSGEGISLQIKPTQLAAHIAPFSVAPQMSQWYTAVHP